MTQAPVPRPDESFASDMLAGKVCLVTGGGTGIGREIVHAMARLGARVVVASRKVENLDKVVAEVKDTGGHALAVQCNVREPTEVEHMVQHTVDRFGTVDILVNNAGANFLCPASQMTPNGWRTVVDVVLNGTFYCSHYVGKVMLGKQSGLIINMAATNGWNGSPMMAHSGAAKAGVLSLTQTLAVEWARAGVRVNAVAPGPVSTEGANSRLWSAPDVMDRLEKRVPLGRFARAADCVGPVLYLCSPAAAFLTGATIVVDGGDQLRHIPEFAG